MAVWLLRSFTSIKDHVLHVSLCKKNVLKSLLFFCFAVEQKFHRYLLATRIFHLATEKNFKTRPTVHFALLLIHCLDHFERINNFNCDFLHWQILSLVCPLKNHVTLLLSHSVLKHMQRWQVSWIRPIQSKCKSNKVRSAALSIASGYLLFPMIINFITVMWLYVQWWPH